MKPQNFADAKTHRELDAPAQGLPITIVWEAGAAPKPDQKLTMVGIEPDQPPEDCDEPVLDSKSK